MRGKKAKQLKKEVKTNNSRLQNFFEIKEINENCLLTTKNEELYYLQITPKNLSVLSKEGKRALVTQLSNIIGGLPQSELLCLNSTQSYETNKQYLKNRSENESNAAVKTLNEKDIEFLDKIRISMATSRIFFLLIRQKANFDTPQIRLQNVNEAVQKCKENNFDVTVSPKEVIKKMLAIYLEQNIYQDELPEYDGQQYGLDVDAEEYQLKNFVELIAPSIIDFKHPSHYIIGNTFRRAYAVRTYAKSTEQIALLKELGEMDGITLHIYNRVVAPEKQDKIFNAANRRNKAKFTSSRDATSQIEGESNLSDIKKMIKKSQDSKEAFLHCAVFIEIMAQSPEKLDERTTLVNTKLSNNHIVPDKLWLQQRDGFVSAAPFGFNIFGKEFERVFPATSVANFFPLSYSGKTDISGHYIGEDKNGSNIIVDFDLRSKDKTNGHIAIFGNSGEGKSFLLKLIITIFRQQQKKLYIADIDNEYDDLTNSLGGTNLDMLAGKYFVNLMQLTIKKSDDDNEDDKYYHIESLERGTLLSQHIAYLRDFFSVYKPEMTSRQLDILEIMLEETYKLFHITNDTDVSDFSPTDFPILSDLYKTSENALKHYDEKINKGIEIIYRKDDLRDFILAIRSICIGADSVFFNGYTNIPNANHINFQMSGLQNVNDNLKNAMYMNIFNFMQHKYYIEGDTVVVFDELHELISSLLVINYIRSFVKRGRKRNSDVVLASQNIDDLMIKSVIEYTRPLFSIPTHLFMFYPGKVDVKQFISTANLTQTEYNIIKNSCRGHCLYCCGSERYELDVIAPEHKKALFGDKGGR